MNRILVCALLCAYSLSAQTFIPSQTATLGSAQDHSLAAITKPITVVLSVAALPPACAVSQQAWVSNAGAGQNVYGCTSLNTWTLLGGAGSGSVTNLATGSGLQGGPVTTTGTIFTAELPNAQTGTTYTFVDGDRAKLVTFTNAGSIAAALPHAGTGGLFINGWYADVQNTGAGTLTITPTTSTIAGAASLALTTGQGARIVSDGTNYSIQSGIGGGGGGSGTVTNLATGAGLQGGPVTTTGTIFSAELTNAQSGTTYTFVDGDRAKLVTFTNSGSVAATLPQAGGSGLFVSGWYADVQNSGAGTLTITPTTSTIAGAASLSLTTGQGARIVSDGVNYSIQGGIGGSSSGGGGAPFPSLTVAGNVVTVGANCTGGSPCNINTGSIVHSLTSAFTLSSPTGSGLIYIYVGADGTITAGYPAGVTALTCTGCTGVTPITQFPGCPTPSSALYTINVTSNSFAGTATSFQGSAFSSCGLAAGANVTLSTVGNVTTIAAAGGASYNPVDMTAFFRGYVWAEGVANNSGTEWAFSGANCTGATANSSVVAGESFGVNWTGAACFVWYPNGNAGSFPIKDFLSGSTPKSSTLTTRFIKGATAGNYFVGWSDGQTTTSNFVGIRYNSGANKWQCVVVNGGTDVVSTNSAATPDTAIHTFSVTSGTANSVTCSIDGTPWTSAGTIPAHDWYAVMGTPTGANAFTTIEARIQILGLSR